MTRSKSQRLILDLSKTWVVQRLKNISVSAVPRWLRSNVATASRYEPNFVDVPVIRATAPSRESAANVIARKIPNQKLFLNIT